jgi:hypothetical protein
MLGIACSCKKLGRRSRLCMPVSCMLMVLPCQASNPQGHKAVKSSVLVDNVSGTGQGWQQSRSNWTLLAVAGYWTRVHVAKQLATTFLLHSFLLFLPQKIAPSSEMEVSEWLINNFCTCSGLSHLCFGTKSINASPGIGICWLQGFLTLCGFSHPCSDTKHVKANMFLVSSIFLNHWVASMQCLSPLHPLMVSSEN